MGHSLSKALVKIGIVGEAKKKALKESSDTAAEGSPGVDMGKKE